jgi:hypothetical protein
MAENRYERTIDIGFQATSATLDTIRSLGSPPKSTMWNLPINQIDARIHGWLAILGVGIHHAEIFYTAPRWSTAIHADGAKLDEHTKLNWVYGATGSRMCWYRDNKNGLGYTKATTRIGTEYYRWDPANCTEVWSCEIGQPSLVNVGGPHNVVNDTDDGRWCMSLVLKDRRTNELVQWDQAIGIFNPFVVDRR